MAEAAITLLSLGLLALIGHEAERAMRAGSRARRSQIVLDTREPARAGQRATSRE